MGLLEDFRDCVTANVPLGPLTTLKVGGNAAWLARPADAEQLAKLVNRCGKEKLELRVLGAGSNVLVPDEGVAGLVVQLDAPAFQAIDVDKTHIRAGAGAALADVIGAACKHGLTGLEALVGIPGTIGGALKHNASGRGGDIGQFVHAVETMDSRGQMATRLRADLRFGYRTSNLEDLILAATLELERDEPVNIVARVRKLWMSKNAQQPFGPQATAYAFRNPRGQSAVDLIEKSGLGQSRIGGAELSAADPRYVVALPGATAKDVRRLIELVQGKVEERTGVTLELQIDLW